MKSLTLAAVAAATTFAAGAAAAQDANWYVQGNAGASFESRLDATPDRKGDTGWAVSGAVGREFSNNLRAGFEGSAFAGSRSTRAEVGFPKRAPVRPGHPRRQHLGRSRPVKLPGNLCSRARPEVQTCPGTTIFGKAKQGFNPSPRVVTRQLCRLTHSRSSSRTSPPPPSPGDRARRRHGLCASPHDPRPAWSP